MLKLAANVLVIDDDRDVLSTAQMVLKQHFTEVTVAENPKEIPRLMEKGKIDVVILDMNFAPGITTGREGIYWLEKIRELDPSVYVLMNTAYGDINLAVKSMKLGAVDFIVKPWSREKLVATVKTIVELKRSKEKVKRLQAEQKVLCRDLEQGYTQFIARSRAMKPVIKTIEKVAPTDAIVLILGENGTGKELVAREIHRNSERKNAHFIKVDLGAIPETLFESELFGHVKGAFTDARESRPGRFEIASGGTLFLDEIANLDVSLQAKLLTAIQSKEVTRLGSNTTRPADVRIICATNFPIYQMVEEGTFRRDLLYRINTVEITLPPLRERMEDIPLLAFHYLEIFRKKYNKPGLTIGEEALNRLAGFHWPGNIRELQHSVERAVILGGEEILVPDDFIMGHRESKASISVPGGKLDEIEKAAISNAINKGYKNKDRVAAELGLSRSTLYRKMKKYGL
jgi:two-component system response regulator HydG